MDYFSTAPSIQTSTVATTTTANYNDDGIQRQQQWTISGGDPATGVHRQRLLVAHPDERLRGLGLACLYGLVLVDGCRMLLLV